MLLCTDGNSEARGEAAGPVVTRETEGGRTEAWDNSCRAEEPWEVLWPIPSWHRARRGAEADIGDAAGPERLWSPGLSRSLLTYHP